MKVDEIIIMEKTNNKFDSISIALEEWYSKNRRMGCVAATDWFCKRVPEFKPLRLNFYTKEGIIYQHVIATDGKIRIDLAPYAALPKDYNPQVDGKLD